MEKPTTTRMMSDLLDLHLTRSINRLKPMAKLNKFAEISAKFKATKASLDAEMDDLGVEIDQLSSQGMDVISQHKAEVREMRAAVKDMRDALVEDIGSNSNGSQTEDEEKPATFPGTNSLGTG